MGLLLRTQDAQDVVVRLIMLSSSSVASSTVSTHTYNRAGGKLLVSNESRQHSLKFYRIENSNELLNETHRNVFDKTCDTADRANCRQINEDEDIDTLGIDFHVRCGDWSGNVGCICPADSSRSFFNLFSGPVEIYVRNAFDWLTAANQYQEKIHVTKYFSAFECG